MKKVLLKIKALPYYSGPPLKYESDLASGFDIRAQIDDDITIAPGQRLLIPTGLSFEVAPNYELQVRPRSGLAIKKGVTLVNSPGTIDADYRGEVKIIVINHGNELVTISPQDRIAQLVLCPVVQAEFEWVSHLGASKKRRGWVWLYWGEIGSYIKRFTYKFIFYSYSKSYLKKVT